jgi:hypothetical protein
MILPAMLVKTWLYILTSPEEDDTKRHAKEMLNDAFGKYYGETHHNK